MFWKRYTSHVKYQMKDTSRNISDTYVGVSSILEGLNSIDPIWVYGRLHSWSALPVQMLRHRAFHPQRV